MTQTEAGAKRMVATMIEKYGSYQNYKIQMALKGSIGGQNSRGYKWAHGKADPAECGRKSKRTKKRV